MKNDFFVVLFWIISLYCDNFQSIPTNYFNTHTNNIHVNNNGMPGPVLAWLATSGAWTNGVAQNVQGANGDCCTLLNPQCTLVAPPSTPHVSSLSNTKRTFIVSKPNNNCEWLTKGTLLDIHGPNFQQKINGKLTKGVPGMDIIAQSTFVRV